MSLEELQAALEEKIGEYRFENNTEGVRTEHPFIICHFLWARAGTDGMNRNRARIFALDPEYPSPRAGIPASGPLPEVCEFFVFAQRRFGRSVSRVSPLSKRS